MTPETLLLLGAGAISGGFINGLAGFGTALFALGFWLQFIPPPQAVAIVVVVSAVTGVQGVWIVRHDIGAQPARLMRFLLPALIGTPIGVQLLSWIDAWMLKLTIAGFMLLFGGFFILRRTLPKFERHTPLLDSIVGFFGGVLGGAASLSGALPTMWCAMRPWAKQETRAVLQPFNVIILFLTAALLAFRGVYAQQTLIYLAVALPITMLSAQAGIYVFRHISDLQFRRLLIGMMFLSGILLSARELL
ncbi:sulfite exporter TauE/SafE family protein [Limimaricola cinnabarinus]|uniref:sulfite exporter TauE/SafE family protein n=1 Tax=Limimaricola cinnabarinus TaxID=1125964 RepID=UPI00248FFBF2|nr:sulfite exporter TauE/SafE family protein [Limimaricola cinnabarinus]